MLKKMTGTHNNATLYKKMFVYAVALPFKANHLNIMFGGKKKLTVCVGPMYFGLKLRVPHKAAKSCFFCQVDNSPASSRVC
jgi:hypothetical protein